MEFRPSPGFTVGLELEFQLLDPASFDLVDGILPLLDTYPEQQAIKAEFIQNTVELVSPPAASLSELEEALRPLLRELLAHCDRLGMGLCGAGTHPFYRRSALITPGRRYAAMEQANGWLGHNQVTFATHVHLGLPDGEEAVRLMHQLRPFLPLLIALSASSPFWHGADTRFAAFRQRVLASARTYGTPPDFGCWADFEHCFATLQRAGLLQALNDIHWDLRPRPDFGTLEVRVMDAQPTLSRALELVAFLRALCRFLQHSRRDPALRPPLIPLPWWSLKDNGYAACRDGIEARLITSAEGDLQPLAAIARATFRLIEPFAEADERPRLARLLTDLEGNLPYHRQRQLHRAGGSLQTVVEALAQELRADSVGTASPATGPGEELRRPDGPAWAGSRRSPAMADADSAARSSQASEAASGHGSLDLIHRAAIQTARDLLAAEKQVEHLRHELAAAEHHARSLRQQLEMTVHRIDRASPTA